MTKRITYYQDDDFHLAYIIHKGIAYLHCDVYTWKLSSFKQGLSVFKTMLKDFYNAGILNVISITPNPKFCEVLGGRKYGYAELSDGSKLEVYKWDLTQLQQSLEQ